MKPEPRLLTQLNGTAESIHILANATNLAKTYPPKIQPLDEMELTDEQRAELVKRRAEAVEAVRSALPKLDKIKADLEALTALIADKPAPVANSDVAALPEVVDEPAESENTDVEALPEVVDEPAESENADVEALPEAIEELAESENSDEEPAPAESEKPDGINLTRMSNNVLKGIAKKIGCKLEKGMEKDDIVTAIKNFLAENPKAKELIPES